MLPSICHQQRYATILPRIDDIVKKVNAYQTNAFSAEIATRNGWARYFGLPDSEILKICVELIAYSQQAQARLVQELLNGGIFNHIFLNFDVRAVANLQPNQIYAQYWDRIGVIRFPSKIEAMIGCGQALLEIRNQYSSFMSYLRATNIPLTVQSQSDIEEFWSEFESIRHFLRQVKMPFFNNFTSLCHLLMALGYDCAKPDSVIMGTAVNLGLVLPGINLLKPTYTDRNRRDVIITMQVFSLCRRMRVSVLDLYLLICGGQTGARHLVNPQFYPCP